MALLITFWAPEALAQEDADALELTWTAPRECADAQAVRQEALRLARISPRFNGKLVANGRIEARGGTWYLKLVTTFRGGTGERDLTASSCSTLTETAALLLALILNPQIEREPAQSEPPPPPIRKAKPLELQASVGAQLGAKVGVLRHPAAELGASVGLLLHPFALRGTLGVSPPETAYVNGNSGPGGRAWALAVDVTACWEPRLGLLFVGPCAGAGLSQIRGQGIGVQTPEHAVSTWVSGVFGATAGVLVTRALGVRATGFALLPAHRPKLFLNEIGVVEQSARLGVSASLGLEVRFP